MPTSIPVLCGSIMGKPFSLSARIHNAAYQALGLEYTFVCFGVDDPAAAVAAIRTLGIRGSNVSMPYKQAVIPHLDALDPAAKAIGAVNTINNLDGRLTGYNTDYLGAVRALREVTEPAGKRLAVIGAGGAARAVAYGFREQGADVSVFNRTAEKARELADSLGVRYAGGLGDFDPDAFDVVVNATSVGFRDAGASPLGGRLAAHLIVMDVAFIPTRTKLIAEAAALGCVTVPGTRMMVHQSCGQVELYTGCEQAPFEAMESAMFAEIERLGL